MRTRAVVLGLVLAVVVGVGVLFYRDGVGPIPDPEGCTARVGGRTVDLSTEQARNATIIAAVGVRRGLPARAVSIALATAYQESKLRNLDHGDRDSLGVFQQRPSQGWGTAAQVQDPYYAANAFYEVLAKVDGFETMRITEAAQRVQRSGYPEAYQPHAADARALASALTGYSAGGRFTCVARTPSGSSSRAQVSRVLERGFGPLDVRRASSGALTVPVASGAAGRREGWAVAQFLVAHATDLDVREVTYAGKRWRAGTPSESGWTRSPATPTTRSVELGLVRG